MIHLFKKINKVKWSVLLFMLAALSIGFARHAQASTAQMNTTLIRINTILSQINPLINLAQKQENPRARVKFRFGLLRDDISKIQLGINQQLNRITIQPRQVSPIVGDYVPTNHFKHREVAP